LANLDTLELLIIVYKLYTFDVSPQILDEVYTNAGNQCCADCRASGTIINNLIIISNNLLTYLLNLLNNLLTRADTFMSAVHRKSAVMFDPSVNCYL